MQEPSAVVVPAFVIPVGIAIVVGFWAIAIVNRFARLKNYIKESWSNVDVALKRRYDLIPNLVETVKAYARHEQQVFQEVTEARNRAMNSAGPILEQAKQEGEFVEAVNHLIARVEAYPELKASAGFLELQQELANTEDRIAAARRFYNGNVRDYNSLVQSFPASLIGGLTGAHVEEYFEVEGVEFRTAPSVKM